LDVLLTRFGICNPLVMLSPLCGIGERCVCFGYDPKNKIRLSEIPAPAIRYLALKFPACEHLLARCANFLAYPTEIPA
jgi:hypothetical protein